MEIWSLHAVLDTVFAQVCSNLSNQEKRLYRQYVLIGASRVGVKLS